VAVNEGENSVLGHRFDKDIFQHLTAVFNGLQGVAQAYPSVVRLHRVARKSLEPELDSLLLNMIHSFTFF